MRNVPNWARYLQRANEGELLGKFLVFIVIVCLMFGVVTMSCSNFKPQTYCCAEKQLSGMGKAKAVILILWIILPPFWFFAEFYGPWAYELELNSRYILPIDNRELQDPAYRAHRWERFKYRQDLTAKPGLLLSPH